MGSRKTNQEGIKIIKCVHFDRGYCKFGEKCKNKHNDKVCNDKDCINDNCDFRHPNPCKYGPRCKFYLKKVCLYSHVKLPCEENRSKIKELEKKILAFEKVIDHSNVGLAEQVDKKLESLENKMKTFVKVLEEKDSRISSLENKLENLQKKTKEEKNHKEKKIKDLENLLKKQQTNQNEVERFNCTTCEFTTTSKQGLKTHVTRKHTEITS